MNLKLLHCESPSQHLIQNNMVAKLNYIKLKYDHLYSGVIVIQLPWDSFTID